MTPGTNERKSPQVTYQITIPLMTTVMTMTRTVMIVVDPVIEAEGTIAIEHWIPVRLGAADDDENHPPSQATEMVQVQVRSQTALVLQVLLV